MLGWILKKILGSKNQREIKRMAPITRQINELEQKLHSLSDDQLRERTATWKEELAKLPTTEEQWKRLDEILPEAFAVVKNAARRLTERGQSFTVCDHPMKWEMIPFDVQLIGGMALHRGKIAEMATGEGKTLVATLPVYLNALDRPRRACGDGQRLPRAAATRMDGRSSTSFSGSPSAAFCTTNRRMFAASNTLATSPTAPTPSSASITCATTAWPRRARAGPARPLFRDRGRSGLDPDRRSAHAADHQRAGGDLDNQYDKCKPLVEQLGAEAEHALQPLRERSEGAHLTPGKMEEGGSLVVQGEAWSARNEPLLRMMEDPEKRRPMDKAELQFYQDTRKEELYAQKEELFFAIDEKATKPI